MAGEEQIEKLKSWVESDAFPALIAAYPQHYKTGTTGTEFQTGPRPAVINEHGVLEPRRFTEYMIELQSWARNAADGQIDGSEAMQNTMALLQSTLGQMIGSVSFGDTEHNGYRLKELFEQGKEMGSALREYRNIQGLNRGDQSSRERK